jgi:hypothetical protein
MTKEEFLKKLAQVDWFYDYLENSTQHRRAYNFYFEVYLESRKNEEFKELFDAEKERHFPSQQIVS